MPDLEALRQEMLALRKQNASIENLQRAVGLQVGRLQRDIESVVSTASQVTDEVSRLETLIPDLTARQTTAAASLVSSQADVLQVEARASSATSGANGTRSVVQTLLQQLVHPNVVWDEGTGTYSLPDGEISINEATQARLAALNGRV